MRFCLLSAACVLWISLTASPLAQFRNGEVDGAKPGDELLQRWQSGVMIQAAGGACTGIVAYIPVPVDWPEQQVNIAEEDISPEAKVDYVTVDETVKIMVVRIRYLAAGKTARALVTFQVRRSSLLPPDETDQYVLPDLKKLDRGLRVYLGPSPLIESRDRRIRSLAKEIAGDEEKAWDKVEAIYDWVRQKVEYKNGPIKGALKALEDGTGDCEELTSLFIAICRAAGIPARTVWVPGHCYAEFYLEDAQGKGHWFPCQTAGSREFGGITEHRPILQKGDNFRPPWNTRDHQRYLAEHLTGTGGRPRVKWVRKKVSN